MKAQRLAVLLLLVTFHTFGQSLPDAPKPAATGLSKKQMWEHITLTAVGVTTGQLDAWSTRRVITRGGVEEDPLGRPFVHSPALYAWTGAFDLGLGVLGLKMHASHNRFLQRTWWIPQTIQISGNTYGWRHNVNVYNTYYKP